MRDHLKQMHMRMAEHFAAMTKHHSDLASAYQSIPEVEGEDQFSKIAGAHAAAASECADCGAFHVACAKAISMENADTDSMGKVSAPDDFQKFLTIEG